MTLIIVLLTTFLALAEKPFHLDALHQINNKTLPPSSDCQECGKELTVLAPGKSCELFSVAHGCFVIPPKKDPHTLIIYIRGTFENLFTVPPQRAQASFQNLLTEYGLQDISNKTQKTLYMTTSSTVSFNKDDIENMIRATGLEKPVKLILAAHSGGHKGLYDTLKNLQILEEGVTIHQLILLDSFYMDQAIVDIYKKTVEKGASCRGFLTQHNQLRYEQRFKPLVPCSVQGPAGFDHSASLKKCLAEFLSDKDC